MKNELCLVIVCFSGYVIFYVSTLKYENNIAFKLKKTDKNKNAYYDEVTYLKFKNEIEYLTHAFMAEGLRIAECLNVLSKQSMFVMIDA